MQVYLDNAATSKIDQRVLKKMLPYYEFKYGNASAIHFMGQENDIQISKCKNDIAKILQGQADNIIFTASATEANNLIIKGVMRANRARGTHFLISSIEHPCVLAAARDLLDEGFTFDYIKVNEKGIIDLRDLRNKIKKDTVLISVMAVNNEIGTIQPIEKIGQIAKEKGIYFHCDAVQAVPHLKINIKKWGVNFLSLSAHKFHGPQGVALAYIDKNIKVKPIIVGGGQEKGLRAGTYNMAGIVGMTEALKLAYQEREKNLRKIKNLRDSFERELKKRIKNIRINGDLQQRVVSNLNVMFEGIEGEAILIDLSLKGICVSTGSACSAQNLKVSSVITAMGIDPKYMNSNIRFSWSKYNTAKENEYVIKVLEKTVDRLRKITPIK